MMRLALIGLVCALLAACATTPDYPEPVWIGKSEDARYRRVLEIDGETRVLRQNGVPATPGSVPLVILHDPFSNTVPWLNTLAWFDEGGHAMPLRPTIALALPGWEGSAPLEEYSQDTLLNELAAMLERIIEPDTQITLLAPDWAAPLAVAWANRAPGRIHQLILINPRGLTETDWSQSIEDSLASSAFVLRNVPPETAAERSVEEMVASPGVLRLMVREQVKATMQNEDWDEHAGNIAAVMDVVQSLAPIQPTPEIAVRLLACTGDIDQSSTLNGHPNFELLPLPHCARLPQVEAPLTMYGALR